MDEDQVERYQELKRRAETFVGASRRYCQAADSLSEMRRRELNAILEREEFSLADRRELVQRMDAARAEAERADVAMMSLESVIERIDEEAAQ